MEYELLGNTGLRVSEAFLGTMTFGQAWGWGTAPEECVQIIDAYADAGGNVIDTAANYTEGQSEQIIGDALAGRRDRFVLSTKFTFTTDPDDPNAGGSHRKNLRVSLERSLRRLRTDYIDVYWVHVWDERTPIEETLRGLDDAVRAGKILHVGFSNMPAWLISRADTLAHLSGWTRPAAIQVPYNLTQRDAERDLIPMAHHLGLSVAAYSPLAGGILTGKFDGARGADDIRDDSGRATRVDPGSITPRQQEVIAVVTDLARAYGVSPAQVAVAWTRSHSPRVHPIIGARRRAQLLDNLAGLNVQLTPEHLSRLDDVNPLPLGYPAEFVRQVQPLVLGSKTVREHDSKTPDGSRLRRNSMKRTGEN